MQELDEIAQWLAQTGIAHGNATTTTLPSPNFKRDGREFVSFSTNNYLALATDPRLVEAARDGLLRFGVGNCESRLLGGDLQVYRDLEAELANLKHKTSAVLFATGYLANLGALSSLVRSSQLARLYGFKPRRRYRYVYFSDELNHVSINDGIRLSGVEKITYRHVDLNHLEDKLKAATDCEKIIVSDGIFSQDGDIAPLRDLLDMADRHDAMLYIDDAHASGVLGPSGGGTAEHFAISSPRLIQMGTLSKAFGALGGFVATERHIAEAIRLSSPAYGFTCPIPPDQACAVMESLSISRAEPERRTRLWDNKRIFSERVQALGYRLISNDTPILPLLVGDEQRCDQMASQLKAEGLYVDAVKYPAVGLGQARLRFIMNANHSVDKVEQLLSMLAGMAQDYVDPGEPRRPAVSAARRTAAPFELVSDLSTIQAETLDELIRIARTDLGVTSPIELDKSLRADLNLDSMGLMIVAGALEDRFGISFEGTESSDIETVADLLAFVERQAQQLQVGA